VTQDNRPFGFPHHDELLQENLLNNTKANETDFLPKHVWETILYYSVTQHRQIYLLNCNFCPY